MLPCRCHTLHCTPSKCWQVQPRLSTPCWCQFKYSIYTCEDLSSSFKTSDSPSVPQEVSETVHCHHSRCFKSVPVCGATRKLHIWKTWFTHCQLIQKRIAEAAETISQQPGIFERTSQPLLRWHQLCIEVYGRTFEHPVSIYNELQLFSEYYSGFTYFPTSVGPTLMIYDTSGMHVGISCLTINLSFGPSYPLTKFEHGVFPHLYTSI